MRVLGTDLADPKSLRGSKRGQHSEVMSAMGTSRWARGSPCPIRGRPGFRIVLRPATQRGVRIRRKSRWAARCADRHYRREVGTSIKDSGAVAGWADPFVASCAAFAALLHPHGEVALHDLKADRVVAIWNPISGRSVGDPSLIDELPERWEQLPVQGPYEKVLADGRKMSAVSAVVRDARGIARGLLCVNLDRSVFDSASELLHSFASPVVPRPPELFRRDWREQIALTLDAERQQRGVDRERLGRADRREILAVLDTEGLLATRGAASHAARALGVSRATVHSLLREARA